MCIPSISSVSSSTKNLTNPSLSKTAIALELALNGKIPFFYLTPSFLSCCSVLPTLATSGDVYTTPGTTF